MSELELLHHGSHGFTRMKTEQEFAEGAEKPEAVATGVKRSLGSILV